MRCVQKSYKQHLSQQYSKFLNGTIIGIPNAEMDKASRKSLINSNKIIDIANLSPHMISRNSGKSITSPASGQTHRMSEFSFF